MGYFISFTVSCTRALIACSIEYSIAFLSYKVCARGLMGRPRKATPRHRQVPPQVAAGPREEQQELGQCHAAVLIDVQKDFLFLDGKVFWMGKNSFSHWGVLH